MEVVCEDEVNLKAEMSLLAMVDHHLSYWRATCSMLISCLIDLRRRRPVFYKVMLRDVRLILGGGLEEFRRESEENKKVVRKVFSMPKKRKAEPPASIHRGNRRITFRKLKDNKQNRTKNGLRRKHR